MINRRWLILDEKELKMTDMSKWYYQEYVYGERTSSPAMYIQADDLSTVQLAQPRLWQRFMWWIKGLFS